MNDDLDLDPRLLDWLTDGPTTASGPLVDAAFARAATVRQVGAWRRGPWGDPMGISMRGRMPRPAPAILLVVFVLAMTVTTLVVGSLVRSKGGPARNGPLAFVSGDTETLKLIDRPGAVPRAISSPRFQGKEASLPAISPDGTRIAFYFLDPVTLTAGVGIMALDGSSQLTLPATFVPPGPDGLPLETGSWGPIEWAPDGRHVVYIDRVHAVGTVVVADPETGTARPIPIPGGLAADSPSWSPDGGRIVLRAIDTSQARARTGLAVLDPESGQFQALTPTDGLFDNADYAAPEWSPDGSSIAFHAARVQNGPHDIFTVRPDGSARTAIASTGADERWPIWSPDGLHLAWQAGSGTRYDANVANADGSDPRMVSGPVTGKLPGLPIFAWSPDGSELLSIVCDAQACEPVLMDALGSSEPEYVEVPAPGVGALGVTWGRQP